MFCYVQIITFILFILNFTNGFPDQGVWDIMMVRENSSVTITKSLYNGSQIFLQINCESKEVDTFINIRWTLSQDICWRDYQNSEMFLNEKPDSANRTMTFIEKPVKCGEHINLDNIIETAAGKPIKPAITKDGIYLFNINITSNKTFTATAHVKMRGTYGYLSAVDWPLLPFYGGMCLVYVLLGLIWLLVSFLQWRDLLRIQFWIGGVILLGMLEKATFYAEYQSINATGVSVKGAVLFAEWVSCGKRTLARMLVIIVSLGFGIVKPRLGPMLHRVVGTGALYFILASVESYLRVMHPKNDPSNQILVASIPLAVLDSAICWWIFTSLVQTTRTLRLRRNMVKLSLYRHFTNTLIFAVFSSVVFMLYSIKTHRLATCLTDWKELWVDEAFWHVLFSVLLLVIMILWRPTNNNQRYAFTPLLDNPEDDDDDEDDQFVSDAFGVKMRGYNRSASPKPKSTTNNEDDLRWVEENIPATMGDAALPVLDSDEEIMNTKFEVSKMQ